MSIQLVITKHDCMDSTRPFESEVARGEISSQWAAMWCLSMFNMHESHYGTSLVVTDVNENNIIFSSTTYYQPSGWESGEAAAEMEAGALSYEFKGDHVELAALKNMLLWCARALMSFHTKEMESLIDKISVQQCQRELAQMR